MTDEQKKKAERNRRYRQRKKAILTHLPDVVDLVPPSPASLAPKAAQEELFNKQYHATPSPEDEERWRQAPSSEKIRPLPRAPEDNPYPEPYTKEEIELVAKSFDEASDAIEYAAERRERVENQMKQIAKIRCNANELLWEILRNIKLLRLDLGAIHGLHVD